jgi:hypothetical protein
VEVEKLRTTIIFCRSLQMCPRKTALEATSAPLRDTVVSVVLARKDSEEGTLMISLFLSLLPNMFRSEDLSSLNGPEIIPADTVKETVEDTAKQT